MRTCGFTAPKEENILPIDLLWEYINIVKTMDETPGLYTMDDIRTKTHAQLVQMMMPVFRGLSRNMVEELLMEYLHNLDKYKYNAVAIMKAIKKGAKTK